MPEIPRIFGPKPADNYSIGKPCPRCRVAFKAGDFTTLEEVEPADEEEARKKARGAAYTARAQEVHYICPHELRDVFETWTVYRHPKDYPQSYVTRIHYSMRDGRTLPAPDCHAFPDIDGARSVIPPDKFRLVASPGDDPCIVETWI